MSDPTTNKPSGIEMLAATRQLALLVRLGFPVAGGLKSMDPQAAPWLGALVPELERGDSLPEAAARHPRLFSPFYVSMLQAAEESPRPLAVLETLSSWLEHGQQLERRLRTLLLYPWIVGIILLLYAAVMTLVVQPTVLMPLSLVSKADASWSLSPAVALARCLLIALLAVWVGLPLLRRSWAETALGLLPQYRRLRRRAFLSSWARGLSALVAARLPLPAALQAAPRLSSWRGLESDLAAVTERVLKGSQLSQALAAVPDMEPVLVWGAEAGEQHENLAAGLMQAAEDLENDLEFSVEYALRMLAPTALAMLGAITLLVALSFWAPFYLMTASIH